MGNIFGLTEMLIGLRLQKIDIFKEYMIKHK